MRENARFISVLLVATQACRQLTSTHKITHKHRPTATSPDDSSAC
jgi:hypothetical protein